MTRTGMDADLAALITPHTGAILAEKRTERGWMSEYTGIIDSEKGRVFVKGVRDPGRNSSSSEREAAINPYVRALSPPLLWKARDNGWYALGFKYVPDTRHATFKPGSPDLPAVVAAVDRINRIPLPCVAGERCSAWREADPAALDAFAVAVVRMYQRFQEIDPAPWRKAMTASAVAWAEHRGKSTVAVVCLPSDQDDQGCGPSPCAPDSGENLCAPNIRSGLA